MRSLLVTLLLCLTTSCVHAQGNLSVPMKGTGTMGPAHGTVAPPCTINPPNLPDGLQGTAYPSTQLTASNCSAPLTWSISTGSLPTGLSLSSGGLVSGTPSGTGSSAFTITLVDNASHAPTFPVSVSITSNAAAGTPLSPDTALSAWDTSIAGTPTSNITDCVGTPVNASILPGGGCASSFAGSTAGLQAALNAVSCGHIINVAALSAGSTIAYGAVTLPNNKKCANSAWIWLTGDLSDPTVPPEGTRADPCYAGFPQIAMPWYPYPGANATPNTCARHIPQIISTATSNNPPIRLSIPGTGTNTPSIGHWRIQRLQCARDQTSDSVTTGCIDLNFQPAASGQDCAIVGGLPGNAAQCATDQPDHIVISQIVDTNDSQRQTVRAISLGGGTFLAVQDSWIQDIQDTYAGGQGDAQSIAGGFGRGYTGVGNWIFKNNFTASSTEGQLYCGAFSEPTSPVTNKDGVPTSVIQNLLWLYKPIVWDTQRGQAANETLVNEGISYPPIGDQEVIFNPLAFQIQLGTTLSLNNNWLNDSAGGWNRFTDSAGAGTVTVDGVDYHTINSANGIVTRTFVTVGSNPWQMTNIIQWAYVACSGAGVPIASCTGATTAGTHTLVFNQLVIDGRLATLGNDRHIINTITATVTSGAPTNQIFLTPSAPDLQIQPSYSDSFNNTRNFAYVFTAALNFSSVSLTWKVDGIANGNSTVGRICLVTAVPCTAPASNDSRVVYVSGTGVGSHIISVTSAAGTTTSQAINVSKTSPIWGYDLKAMTVKNMWEAKCINRGILRNSLLENTWGSQGNGGGQYTSLLTQPANNANQVTDGSGATVGYGPMNISDLLVDHVHILHGGGLTVASLNNAKGIHRVTFSNDLLEDVNCLRWGHGFLKPLFCVFVQFSGASGPPLSWTSALTPPANDVNFSHITSVGGTSTAFGINSWLSIANRNLDTTTTPPTGQYQLGPFAIKDSIFEAPGNLTFTDNNGMVNNCNTVGGKVASANTEANAFGGAGYTPPKPCFSTYSLARNLLLDSTTLAANFTTPTIWQAPSTSTDVFRNYNAGSDGDYRVPTGSQYAAGGARCSSDGCVALGADIAGITTNDGIIRWGNASPLTITTTALPDATHGVSYSQTLAVTGGTGPYIWTLPGGPKPPGSEDILDYAAMPSPDRNNFHLSGTIVKYFKIDAGLLWWIKGASGNPQDGELIGPNYIHQWFTEGASFTNASGFKMYLNPPPLWKRYHKAGDDDVVYTPGPNNYSTTANCGADGSPLNDNLGVRGELTGPFTDVTWQTTYGGSIPDGTPYLLAQKWIKCTANDITTCNNEEDYWLVKGYGQVRWCPKTWNGSTYVTGTCSQETTKVAGGAPTPNFACGVPTPTNLGLPAGTTRASAPPMSLGDTTGTISGTLNTGSYSMTVQVEDSLGRIAQRTLTLNVN